jgi:hypothetical protein
MLDPHVQVVALFIKNEHEPIMNIQDHPQDLTGQSLRPRWPIGGPGKPRSGPGYPSVSVSKRTAGRRSVSQIAQANPKGSTSRAWVVCEDRSAHTAWRRHG